MSSYRGNNYTPAWQKSSNTSNNHQNKSQNGKDRASSSSNNNRYGTRSPSYNSTSPSNNSDSSQSASRIPTTGYQYRRTPSILKKYANFTPPKYADASKTAKPEPQNSKCSTTSKSRVASCSPPAPNQKLPIMRAPFTKGKERLPEIVTRVTRATSPTPARTFAHSPRKADDDVLISDAPRRRNVQTTDHSTQTEVYEQPSSRTAVLAAKFSTNSGSTNSRPISPRIPVYNCPKSTIEPPAWKTSPEPSRYCSSPQRDELLSSSYSPQPEGLLRTPSPFANLNNSLTKLTIEQPDDSDDTENESSYEEDYPMRLEKDPYPLTPSNGAVKPPMYPLSPKSRVHQFVDHRPANVRSPSSDELSEVPIIVEPNIPFTYQMNQQPPKEEDAEYQTHPQHFAIRKMDSGELPWWQNSASDHSSDHQPVPAHSGFIFRKMDSTEAPWWNKDSPIEASNRPSSASDCNKSESEGQTWCVDAKKDCASGSQGYVLRKMDSMEAPWWNKDSSSEANNRASSTSDCNRSGSEGQAGCVDAKDNCESESQGYVLRKMDSMEAPWWNKDSSSEVNNRASNTSEPESRTSCVHSKDGDSSSQNQGYVLRKMDSTETPWWNKSSQSEANNRAPSASDFNKSESEGPLWYLDSRDECSPKSQGLVMRKMDSFDSPWWCKSNDSHSSSRGEERICVQATPASSVCHVRKMDSNEVLWSAANSEESHSFELVDQSSSSGYKLRKFDSGERDWWAEDERSKTDTPDWCRPDSRDGDSEYVENYTSSRGYRITRIEPVERETSNLVPTVREEYRIKKIDSGEEAWWLKSDEKHSKSEDSSRCNEAEPIQDVEEAEGSYRRMRYVNELENLLLYIGKHTNIDELLGTEVPPPAAPTTPNTSSDDELGLDCEKIAASQVKIHDGSAYTSTIRRRNPQFQLDDAALQLYKDGDYSSYLDLDSSISEQQEEFEGFQPNRKDSIVVRTQLSVRVHSIIEKLMKSEGRELRRALFSLKQIFQEDKDLVHEFVQNDGLDCLIKVGSDVDQNYQNYILRALGQVMLYVDGMNGVMEHNPTIQWLYSLVSSKFRLVVKTVLKLLLVFVEYVESNCLLLIKAIHTLNTSQGLLPWSNLMRLLHEYDATDTELLIYAMTLINKTLNGIPDQDTYYDQVDLLEEQDIELVIRKYMSKPGTDLDLLRQFQIYEAVLQHEDGEEKGTPLKQLDEAIRKTLRNRKSLTNGAVNSDERRKSRRHSTGTTALSHGVSLTLAKLYSETSSAEDYRIKQTKDGAGVTPGLRKRRERDARQRSLLREQFQNNMRNLLDTSSSEDGMKNGAVNGCPLPPQIYVNSTVNKLESAEDLSSTPAPSHNNVRAYCNGDVSPTLKREATVKDITQKLASLQTPAEETAAAKPQNLGRVEEMKGIISKAMEGLAKSQSRCDVIRSPTSETPPSQVAGRAAAEVKKSETDLHWEELLATSRRALLLCDLDFSDLQSDDEHSVLAPTMSMNGIPPPPPPCGPGGAPPPIPNVPKAVSNKGKKTVKLFWKEVREDPIVMTKLKQKQLIWDEMYPVIIDTQRLEHLFESRAKDLITKKQHELNKNKEIIVLDPKRSNAINIGMTKLPPPRSIKTAILKMDSTVINREGIEKLLTMLPTEEERSKIQEAQVINPELPLGSAEHFLLTLASISELTARLKLWAFKLNYENIEKEIADPLMDLKQGMEVLRTNKTFRAILSTLLSIGIFLNGLEVKGFQIEYLGKVPEVKDTVHKHSLLHHLCHIVMEKFPDSTDLYSEIGAITRASRVDFDDLGHSIVRVEQECKASFDHLKAIAKHDGNTATKLKLSDFLVDCAERIIALGKIHRRILNRFYAFCLWLGIPLHRVQATKPNEMCKVISEFALEYRTTRERVLQQLEKKASHRERNKTRGKMITEVGKFRSKEDRQDDELRQLLKKEQNPQNDAVNNNFQGTLMPWRRLRKDSPKSMVERNVTNGHLVDADDELLETLVKTATKTPAARNGTRERKRTRHTDRKSLRRTLKNGLTDEERNHLSAFIKSY